MAPRKEKLEKANADQGTTMILDYLIAHIRSEIAKCILRLGAGSLMVLCCQAIDISANLHNKVTKTYAVKALKELHEQNLIAGKAAGKQIVYHAVQDPEDAASPEDIAAMDQEITDLREDIAAARAEEKHLKANLLALNATMSTQDLRSSILAFDVQKKELLGRLGPLRSGNVKPVSSEEKAAVDKAWKEWSKNANVRKKICMELWDFVTEEMPEGKTKEDLWEERGLEGDD